MSHILPESNTCYSMPVRNTRAGAFVKKKKKTNQRYEETCYLGPQIDSAQIFFIDFSVFTWFPSYLSHTPGAESGRLLHHIWSDWAVPDTWPIPGCLQHYGGRRGDPAGETLKERGEIEKGRRKGGVFFEFNCLVSEYQDPSLSHTLEVGQFSFFFFFFFFT